MTTIEDLEPVAPPGPNRSEAFKWLVRMTKDRIGMMTAAADYGDACRIPVGHKTIYFFNHPDSAKRVLADNAANYHKGIGLVHAKRALGNGLLTSEDELWRKQRSVVQPAFQSKRIAAQATIVAQEAGLLSQRLSQYAGGEPIDVVQEMTWLTIGVLGRTLLDTDLSEFSSLGASFAAVQDQAMFEVETLSAVPTWVPLPRQRRFRQAREDLAQVVDALIAERAGQTAGRDDVLSRLIISTDQEPDEDVRVTRLRDELVTLLLAGHETTASTLSWALYLIDQHAEVRDRLHAEAVSVLGDRLPTYDDLRSLRYAAMVIEEVMRMYPPVWLLPRKALADDVVGGYRVPAGADVVVSPFTLHRHPSFWDSPEAFDPDRFDPGRANDRPRYAYIPFGAGPRFCVGNHLGMMEATFVLAVLARDLKLCKPSDYDVVPEPMLSLRIRGGLPMSVHLAQ